MTKEFKELTEKNVREANKLFLQNQEQFKCENCYAYWDTEEDAKRCCKE